MTTPPMSPTIQRWHDLVRAREPAALDGLLADDVAFRSPAVHTPQEGKQVTTAYLTAALHVLGPTLTYHREWYAEDSAVLEFTARLDDLDVHGMDVIAWGPDGRITDFCVLVRPQKALTVVIEKMAAALFG